MKSRFDNNDQEILCALGDVVLNDSPLENSFHVVAEFYNVNRDLLEEYIYVSKFHHGRVQSSGENCSRRRRQNVSGWTMRLITSII
jgi:hypothetical protein